MIIKKVTNNVFDIFWGIDDFFPWEWTRIKRLKNREFYRISGQALPILTKSLLTSFFNGEGK